MDVVVVFFLVFFFLVFVVGPLLRLEDRPGFLRPDRKPRPNVDLLFRTRR
jgi:hypothetical protein